MTETTYNQHEAQGRAVKASKLVEALHEAGAASGTIPYIDDNGWDIAARAAGVRAPSPRTRALVHGWFTDRAQRPADPFVGLGLDDVA